MRAAKALGAVPGVRMLPEQPVLEVLETYRPALISLALRLTHNHADAQDLVQDCCERALRSAHKLRDPGIARSWLVAILRNAFLDRCRHDGA